MFQLDTSEVDQVLSNMVNAREYTQNKDLRLQMEPERRLAFVPPHDYSLQNDK